MPFQQLKVLVEQAYNRSKVVLHLTTSNDAPVDNQHTRTIRVENSEIDSRELVQSERELRIRHEGGIYRLRLTSLNKLILTK
jgi:hemin uptake protein HemP